MFGAAAMLALGSLNEAAMETWPNAQPFKA